MNNISEQIAFFFSFWIIPLCILPKVGLLGHLKDENNLAQKDVMTCLGNTAQFSTGEKLLTTPDLDTSPGGLGSFYTSPISMVVFRGSTYSKHIIPSVETHIFIFDLTNLMFMPTRAYLCKLLFHFMMRELCFC